MALHYVIGRLVTRSGTMRQETQWVHRIKDNKVQCTYRVFGAKKFATQDEATEALALMPADDKWTIRRAR